MKRITMLIALGVGCLACCLPLIVPIGAAVVGGLGAALWHWRAALCLDDVVCAALAVAAMLVVLTLAVKTRPGHRKQASCGCKDACSPDCGAAPKV